MAWTIVTIRRNDVRDDEVADVLMTLDQMGVRVFLINYQQDEWPPRWHTLGQATLHRFLEGREKEEEGDDSKKVSLSSPFRAVLQAIEEREEEMVAYVDMRQLVALRDAEKELQFLSFVSSLSSSSPQMATTASSRVYIPGTWDRANDVSAFDTIHWRFQGGFFFGVAEAMRPFCETMLVSIDAFLASTSVHVDVNLLSWAEYTGRLGMKLMTWYAASSQPWSYLSLMPPEVYLHPLEVDEVVELTPLLPVLPGYRPSSIAFLQEGKKEEKKVHWWCVRYVDYFVLDNGAYLLPEGSHGWHTRNLLIKTKDEDEGEDKEYWWLDEVFPDDIEPNPGAQCTGIEDVRLYYYDDNDNDDERRSVLRFVGTNLDHAPSKNVMVSGLVVLDENASLHVDSVWLPPPGHDTVQKNWLPIGFHRWMYTPFSLVHDKEDEVEAKEKKEKQEKQEQVSKKATRIVQELFYEEGQQPWFVERLRGSTVPVRFPLDPSKRIMLTHFVIDRPGQRRAYGHVLLLLDPAGRPVQRSQAFCFVRADIEYCIGMHVLQDQWHVFVSQCDRDPLRLRYAWSRVSWHAMEPVSAFAFASVTRDDVFHARGAGWHC